MWVQNREFYNDTYNYKTQGILLKRLIQITLLSVEYRGFSIYVG